MARIRTIKPEFFTDPDVAKLNPQARLLYIAMWCAADDFGVGETNINSLLGLAFPDTDEVSAPILRRFCAEIAQHLRVTFYTVHGRHYYAVESWDEHQKVERRSERRKYPPPDHPDATPDLRILGCADFAPEVRRGNGAESCGYGAGTGEQGNRGTERKEPPYPPNDEPSPPRLPAKRTGADAARHRIASLPTRSIDAYRIAQAFSAALPVPIEADLLAGIGTQIDKCLQRGIPPPAIAAGLKAWTDSDSWHPSQIPNFVHKANNRSRNGKPTDKALGYDAALTELLQEVQTL